MIPVFGKQFKVTQFVARDISVVDDVIRRLWVVVHAKFRRMPCDRRAAQAFQNAELNFMRTPGVEFVKALREAVHRLTRQSGDQVNMQMRVAVLAQPPNIFLRFGEVGFARDVALHGGVERLNTDFKL